MHDVIEFFAAPMMVQRKPDRLCLAALAVVVPILCWAQDAQPSLGDIARKARKEHASLTHSPANQVSSEDEDGPDTGGVWRVRQCSPTCYELSVTLPKSPRWIRPAEQPRPVLVPLAGHEEDLSRAIRLYRAESVPATSQDMARKTFLQAWFARPEYFGQGARLLATEPVNFEFSSGSITRFTILSNGILYRGFGVMASAAYGNYGFACAFRDADSDAASSVCEAIMRSARNQVLLGQKPRAYPTYEEPPQYYPQPDDPEDPPTEDDPQ